MSRLRALYNKVMGRRHWLAASPSGNIDLGFLTDGEAMQAGTRLGKVSYIDREACVIFFDVVPQSVTERF